MIEALAIAGVVAASLGITLIVRWLRPGWSRRQISMVSSAVLPGCAIVFCVYTGVDVAMTPNDRCGTDACAMAMVGVVMIASIALAVYFVLVILAEAMQSGLGRR